MNLKLIFAAIPMILLSSCFTANMAESNKRYMTDRTEIRNDAKAEGYLVSTKGGKETYRFRNVLHEKSNSPRIVELSVPENRTRSWIAEMKEVDVPYEPGNKVRYSLRVAQQKEVWQLNSQMSTDSRELIIGKEDSNLILLLGTQGRNYTRHFLKTDLRKVHRSEVGLGLRSVGYVGTLAADAVMSPVYLGWFLVEFH